MESFFMILTELIGLTAKSKNAKTNSLGKCVCVCEYFIWFYQIIFMKLFLFSIFM